MYTTCLFCHNDLGRNEIIEHFPIGRRLAFDASKGRLWVVCRGCERWNLTPLEERWEAIEECERAFTGTRMRVSTDNIGLAKLSEGLTLIRIGGALRPEMAAWRYGDQFGRRRRRHYMLTGAGVLLVGGVMAAGPIMGYVAGGGWGMWQGAQALYGWYDRKRVRAKVKAPDGRLLTIRKNQLEHASVTTIDDEWALRLSLRRPPKESESSIDNAARVIVYRGGEALKVAAKLLPALNETGANKSQVASAVKIIGEAEDSNALFRRYSAAGAIAPKRRFTAFNTSLDPTKPRYSQRTKSIDEPGVGHYLAKLPQEVRLALEMAAHEEQERRALEGELAILEAAWREAEEIAKIADDMFVPDSALEPLKSSG